MYVCLQPSAVVFCHGRLYVASTAISRNLASFPQQGYIYEYILDGDYKVTSYKLVSSIGPLVGNSRIRTILGLACDPWDTSNDFKLYFSRSSLFRSQMDQAVVNSMTQYSVPQKVTYDGAVCFPVPLLRSMLFQSSRCGRIPALREAHALLMHASAVPALREAHALAMHGSAVPAHREAHALSTHASALPALREALMR